MDLVAQSNEWITKPGTMGRSQSDLPTGKTGSEADDMKSRRTNSLTFDSEKSVPIQPPSNTVINNQRNQRQGQQHHSTPPQQRQANSNISQSQQRQQARPQQQQQAQQQSAARPPQQQSQVQDQQRLQQRPTPMPKQQQQQIQRAGPVQQQNQTPNNQMRNVQNHDRQSNPSNQATRKQLPSLPTTVHDADGRKANQINVTDNKETSKPQGNINATHGQPPRPLPRGASIEKSPSPKTRQTNPPSTTKEKQSKLGNENINSSQPNTTQNDLRYYTQCLYYIIHWLLDVKTISRFHLHQKLIRHHNL